MPVDPQILELLVCPETHVSLKPAPEDLLQQVNERIQNGEVSTHSGSPVTTPLAEALLREDGGCLYRVDDNIPNLLVDDRIDL